MNYVFRKRSSRGAVLAFSSVGECVFGNRYVAMWKILMFDFVFQSVKTVLAFFGKILKVQSALNMKLLEQFVVCCLCYALQM